MEVTVLRENDEAAGQVRQEGMGDGTLSAQEVPPGTV